MTYLTLLHHVSAWLFLASSPGSRDAPPTSVMGQRVSGGLRTVLHTAPFQSHLGAGGVDFLWGLEAQCPARLGILLDEPPAGREEQLSHAWNPDDRSLNLFIKDEDQLTVHRHPIAQSTDAIRGECFR